MNIDGLISFDVLLHSISDKTTELSPLRALLNGIFDRVFKTANFIIKRIIGSDRFVRAGVAFRDSFGSIFRCEVFSDI